MSKLLEEAMQDLLRVEEWAAKRLPPRNSTQLPPMFSSFYPARHPSWRPSWGYPTIGNLTWLPQARWANASALAHNASAPALAPWARFRRREPASSRVLLHWSGEVEDASESPLLAFAPQLAGVHQLRDEQHGLSMLHLRTNDTLPCACHGQAGSLALIYIMTSAALLVCMFTLLAVWLLWKRLDRRQPVQVVYLDKVAGVPTASFYAQDDGKPQPQHAPESDRM